MATGTGIVTAVEMHLPAGPIPDPEHSIDSEVYAHEGRFIHANEIDGDLSISGDIEPTPPHQQL